MRVQGVWWCDRQKTVKNRQRVNDTRTNTLYRIEWSFSDGTPDRANFVASPHYETRENQIVFRIIFVIKQKEEHHDGSATTKASDEGRVRVLSVAGSRR
jgi:hypothetical protein